MQKQVTVAETTRSKSTKLSLPQSLMAESMAKVFILFIVLFFSQLAIGQGLGQRFECHGHSNSQGFTLGQIDSIISRVDFENFRLQGDKDTLVFDNGFSIVLHSANEMQQSGQINNAATYKQKMPEKFKKPTFHINQAGKISAAYEIVKPK